LFTQQKFFKWHSYSPLYCVAWLLLTVCGGTATGHPVSLSSAIVEVSEQDIRVELQIMLEDLVLYHGLIATEELEYSTKDLTAAANKHHQFILDFFSIIDSDGNRLAGSVEDSNFEQIGSDSVPQKELMQRFVQFTVKYHLFSPKPAYLTLIQNFGGDTSVLPAIMDVHIIRDGLFEESAQIAYGRAHTVNLDWIRELNGKRETLAELRQRRKDQFQKRLGITSYTGLYSFLYLTHYSVRHEILIPLLTLENWIPLERSHPDFLEIDEQMAARAAIEDFFLKHNSVWVNDIQLAGRVERINFFGLDINDFALNSEPRRINMYQARLGIILNYPSRKSPEQATVTWDIFSDHAPFLDTVLLVGFEKPERFYFHPKSTTFQWKGGLARPQLEPASASTALSAPQEQNDLIQKILGNIYKAFSYREDEEVYDALATSLHGDLLRQVYLRIKRSLLMSEHGGELSQATNVEVKEVTPLSGSSKRFVVKWQVSSLSEHWGHMHRRLTEYQAELGLVAQNGFWKLDHFQLLDEKRLQFETSIRGYDPNR
jgi:hypothetical protein